MIVTTSYRPTESTILTAEKKQPDARRPLFRAEKTADSPNSANRARMMFSWLEKSALSCIIQEGEKFFFHPNSAMFRAKRMLRANQTLLSKLPAELKGTSCSIAHSVLDQTPSLRALQQANKAKCVGIEKSPLVAFLSRGGASIVGDRP